MTELHANSNSDDWYAQLDRILNTPAHVIRERHLSVDGKFRDLDVLKEIVIMGAGNMGRMITGALLAQGVKVVCVCDNDASKWGMSCEGLPVLSVRDAAGKYGETHPFVVSIFSPGTGYREHRRQLQEYGCRQILHVGMLLREFCTDTLPHFSFATVEKYKENAGKYLNALELLEENKSREIYARNLMWLITLDDTYLPLPSTTDQYFPTDIVRMGENESFVDCGAYIGDTLIRFLEMSEGKFRAYFAFEPDPVNFMQLERTVRELPDPLSRKVALFKTATGAVRQRLRFKASGVAGSSLDTLGDVLVDCVPIDELLSNEEISYVKMDVEGAEIATLSGSSRLIAKNIPKLAVCIYHSPDDLWSILHDLRHRCPEYGLYVRAHQCDGFDIVAYAIPR